MAFDKKKVETEIKSYFPGLSNDVDMNEFNAHLKVRLLSGCIDLVGYEKYKQATGDESVNEKFVILANEYFYSITKPQVFHGPQGKEIEFDNKFDSTCVALSQVIGYDPVTMTTRKFLRTISDINEQNKVNEKTYNK